MDNKPCFLCNREAEVKKMLTIGIMPSCEVKCPSCGNYTITQSAVDWINAFGVGLSVDDCADIKFKVSCILSEIRLLSKSEYIITDNSSERYGDKACVSVSDLLSYFPKSPLEIIDRALINLSKRIDYPYEVITITDDQKELFYVKHAEGINYILLQLQKHDYIVCENFLELRNEAFVNIETEGWKRIDSLRSRPVGDSQQAFVAMWFDKSTEDIYDKGIKKAIENDNKILAQRVDLVEHNNKICDQVIAEIRRSKYMVADFTGNRGGVYYEAGFAQGIGIPVIWTVHEDDLKGVHFDTNHYNHIKYKTPDELFEKLLNRIRSTIL